jgi:long-chain acyl-CoA synthetase
MQAAMVAMISRIFDIRPGEGIRTVVTGPVYHSAPNLYALCAARDGGLVILQPRFDAEDLLRQVEWHRITHLHMVPTMFVRLLKLAPEVRQRYDLSSLTFVTHAAAPCPPDVKRQMIEWWGPVINEYLVAPETGGAVFHTSAEALRSPVPWVGQSTTPWSRSSTPPASNWGRARSAKCISGSAASPISPTTAWTTSAARSNGPG